MSVSAGLIAVDITCFECGLEISVAGESGTQSARDARCGFRVKPCAACIKAAVEKAVEAERLLAKSQEEPTALTELPPLPMHSRSQRPGWRVCTVCRHEFRATGDAIVTVAAWMAHAREMHPAILAPKDRA